MKIDVAGVARRFLQPRDYGESVWAMLHRFGACWDGEAFTVLCRYVTKVLDPSEDNGGTGCNICHRHWLQHCAQYPFTKVDSAAKAAVWTWEVHNRANVDPTMGNTKPPLTFEAAAHLHGWVQLRPEEVSHLLNQLKA